MAEHAEPTEPVVKVAKVRRDAGVHKLALSLRDGSIIETVLIPMPPRGDGALRNTLCLSTQVGCAMGCAFCATGRMGLVRQLSAHEIAAQAEVVEALLCRPDNLVFMGMGEPLHNFDNWRAAVHRLIESKRRGEIKPIGYSTHQMTVSTCGYVPGMQRLAGEGFRKMGLALSLNAPNDELRTRLMPVNKRWPMAELRRVIESLPLRGGIFLTEYVLFAGLNDGVEHAEQLAQFLQGLRTLVNLIAYNPAPGLDKPDLRRPTVAAMERFRKRLLELGIHARRRESKGRRIAAACGQLAS
ncbi:MAG: 23S rRNA (adenine(2503)-C(2))-methyltransferase RlmN [Myxococcota bacterium]|jgi:23S rRNA (adenine2503-C2)-methyltransferase|nr:23S rRNA (adenine(2503)-C(2))-methyltransferase RlmN [Myxococcota bacterium]